MGTGTPLFAPLKLKPATSTSHLCHLLCITLQQLSPHLPHLNTLRSSSNISGGSGRQQQVLQGAGSLVLLLLVAVAVAEVTL